MLGIVLVLAAATFSIVSPPRADAASAAFVQGRNAQVTHGTTASLAFSKANTARNLIAVYVVWDNPGTAKVSDTSGNTYTAAKGRPAGIAGRERLSQAAIAWSRGWPELAWP